MAKLYLITGFLGAGKTTFLKNFLQLFPDCRIHIIVNEFGKEGIDGQLLREMGTALDEITNGSIFCSCRLDQFEEALQHALSASPDLIVVEASGLSNPVSIRKILAQTDRFSEIDYMGCICLIDAKQFPKVYDTATVVKKQISVSDIFLMNKTDLASDAARSSICATLAAHRPDVPVFCTSYGVIQPEWLTQITQPALSEEKPEIQKKDITLRSYLITIKDFTFRNFQKFAEMFLDDTYRVKGFAQLDSKVYLVDCVGSMFKAIPYTGEVSRLNELVVLSGNGLPTAGSIREAIKWYPDNIVAFTR